MNPDDEDWQQWASATADELSKTPSSTEISDRTAESLINDAEAARHLQANKMRPWFFWSVVIAMSFSLVSSVAIMAFYIWSQWDHIDSGVMIAWMSAAVVETIGLAYIVANYLFPGDATERPRTAKR